MKNFIVIAAASLAITRLFLIENPPGIVEIYGGEYAPNGWAFVNGQAISRTENPKLFKLYGTRYGEGDGSTTFNLPDLRGRAVLGHDVMGSAAPAWRITGFSTNGIDGQTLGAAGGNERIDASLDSAVGVGGGGFMFYTGEDMNNLPPAMVLNYIVRLR